MHAVVQNLMDKEVSRKEFIALAVSGLVSLIGVSALLKRLGESTSQSSAQSYGGSVYGGIKSK